MPTRYVPGAWTAENWAAQTQPYRLLQAPRSLAARPDAATVQDPARTTTQRSALAGFDLVMISACLTALAG